jgi:hypothetical protein
MTGTTGLTVNVAPRHFISFAFLSQSPFISHPLNPLFVSLVPPFLSREPLQHFMSALETSNLEDEKPDRHLKLTVPFDLIPLMAYSNILLEGAN